MNNKRIKGRKLRNIDFIQDGDGIPKKVKNRSIYSLDKQEEEMDKKIEQGDNISIAVIIIILVLCFWIGILLGYFLYRIAINGGI